MAGLTRRVHATLTEVAPRRAPGSAGVQLAYEPYRSLEDGDRIEDFADLGPEWTVPAVLGLSRVLRVLRVARIAPPPDPRVLIGREHDAAALLVRACGAAFRLHLRPRSSIRFVAWTDAGVEIVDDAADVVESAEAYFVMRRAGRHPVRIPRRQVIRRQLEAVRWFEVVDVERPELAPGRAGPRPVA